MQRLFAYFFQIFKVLYDKIVIMMNENVYFPMYLPQNCPVAQKMLITRFVQNLNKRPNPVAVMFSEEFIRGDIAVGEFVPLYPTNS